MAALADRKSDQYTDQTDGNKKASAGDVDAKVRIARFTYTHAGGAGAPLTIGAVKLPAGKVRVYSDLSWLVASDEAMGADLHIGYAAYVGEDGVSVVADDNAFADNLDVGAGALDQAWPLPGSGVTEFSSQDGVLITVLIDTADIADNDTINGWVAFSHVR